MDYLKSVSIEVIAAFIGFLSALLLDNILDKKSEKKKTNKVVESLYEELYDIVESLSSLLIENKQLNFPLFTPTWNTVQNSGITINLIEHDYYNDLIKTYSAIEVFNYYQKNSYVFDRTECLQEIIKSAKNFIDKIDEEKGK